MFAVEAVLSGVKVCIALLFKHFTLCGHVCYVGNVIHNVKKYSKSYE
jgi:hypothetical protein